MMFRLIAIFGLATTMVGLASAQDKPTAKQEDPTKAQIKEALEVANDDIPKAITILEKALKTSPDHREALYLLGAMSAVQGAKTEEKASRIELFHKSTVAFSRLGKLYKEPTPYEKAFKGRSLIGEARALALEGKNEESLAMIKLAMAQGFDDLDAIEGEKDLDTVRKLPGFKLAVDQALKSGILEEMSAFKPFPFDFELKDTNDKTVTLADYKGKVTIVDIWGTWCGPCVQEIPHFVALHQEYQAKGFEIVGINCNEQGSTDDIKKKIKAFAKEAKIPYKCVLNDDKTEEKIPGFQGYPTTLFLDRSGKVRMLIVGGQPKARLEAIVTTLLAEPSKP